MTEIEYKATAYFDDGLYEVDEAGCWRLIGPPRPRPSLPYYGLGQAPLKTEGAPTGYPAREPTRPPWLSRVTEWPRRKIARALERLADRICRDRDEGW